MVLFDSKRDGMQRQVEPSIELIQEICRKELSHSAQDINAIVGQGMSNKVYRLCLASGERFILRLCDKAAATNPAAKYDKEIWCLNFLRRCEAFRVPAPLGRGSSGSYEYMLEEHIEGTPGNLKGGEQLEIWQRLGACAAIFNALPVTGYGEHVDLSAGGGFTATWLQVVEQGLGVIFRDEYWESSGACTAKELADVVLAFESLRTLNAPAGLVHIDLAPKNCIIEPGNRGIALIDWEMVEGGPTPYSQLAAVAGWWGVDSDIYRSFSKGYESVVGSVKGTEEVVRVLATLNSMHSVRWAQENSADLVSEYTKSASWMIRALGS